MNEDNENPNINPFIYKRNMLTKSPIIVNPSIHIINEYEIFVTILFLNASILFSCWLSMFDINYVILSVTNFWSFRSMMFENIAPVITPRKIIANIK